MPEVRQAASSDKAGRFVTQPGNIATERRRERQADRAARLLPWRRALQLISCQLYWMPASAFPMPFRQRQWLLRFCEQFSNTVAAKYAVKAEIFLQMKIIQPALRDVFLKTAKDFNPVFGLGRTPHTPLPPMPDMKYVEDLQQGRRKFDAKETQPDYCYWFLYKDERRQQESFLGFGGMTMLYLKPRPGEKPPKPRIPKYIQKDPAFSQLLARTDMDRMMDGALTLQSPFLKGSKEMFGEDLKEDPMYDGLLYILPLLDSATFLKTVKAETDQWFSLFDFYFNESQVDRGILLATQHDIEDDLIALSEQLRAEGLNYPE
jgi:hypothetical protein